MTAGHLSSLLDSLIECSFLRNLVLVRMSLNTHHVSKLVKYLDTNYYVRALDLSWNELTPLQMKPLIEFLGGKECLLEDLNLSHNRLYETSTRQSLE